MPRCTRFFLTRCGSAGDLHDWRRLYDLNIRAVVQLAYEEAPLNLPHDLIACRFPLMDSGDNQPELLALAITTLTHLLEQKFGCLVCCSAGLSRSPVIAVAALSRYSREAFATCLQHVIAQHHADIHAGLLQQVQTWCDRSV